MRCVRPGCTGAIDDGYCDDCGMAPAGAQEAVGANDGAPGPAVPGAGPGSGTEVLARAPAPPER